MFANDRQKSRCIRALLGMLGMEKYWSRNELGPGPENYGAEEMTKIRLDRPSLLSTGERLLLRVAFDIWNGSGDARIYDLMKDLDHQVVAAIGEIITAFGAPDDRHVKAWLKTWEGFRIHDAPNGFTVG